METWGSSSETLVFLGGLGCHPRYYRRGFERLAERFRIVVPDLSFRTHRTLPCGPHDYYALVRALADEMAPDAVWVGHSFGALLALMHDGPAVALAPSVPAEVGLSRMFGRAVRQQIREYLGFEGRIGVGFAPRIMVDYVSTALLRPHTIFPSIASLRAPPTAYRTRSPRAIVYLCERDELYRADEYRDYLQNGSPKIRVRRVADCHDWPITNPEGLARRLPEALEELAVPEATISSCTNPMEERGLESC